MRRVALMLCAGLLTPLVVRAQETASDTLLTVNHYLDWEQVSDPQISPDGSQIVYTRRWVNKIDDKWESALWIVGADGQNSGVRHAAGLYAASRELLRFGFRR